MPHTHTPPQQHLQWLKAMGADEFIGDAPRNLFAPAPRMLMSVEEPAPPARPAPPTPTLQHSPALAAANSRELADKATTLAELEAAVRTFDGCILKRTASKTVFADGNPNAPLMVIGEAPGGEEDVQGIPFCGVSGQLLDKMLAAIRITREEKAYITNTVFWRPPGNRQPNKEETAICLPFVEKHIALVKPKLLLLAGGVATTTLLQKEDSMSRLRGKIYEYSNPYLSKPIPTMVTYHPSYLLRMPAQKRLAWQDMLAVKDFLEPNRIA